MHENKQSRKCHLLRLQLKWIAHSQGTKGQHSDLPGLPGKCCKGILCLERFTEKSEGVKGMLQRAAGKKAWGMKEQVIEGFHILAILNDA